MRLGAWAAVLAGFVLATALARAVEEEAEPEKDEVRAPGVIAVDEVIAPGPPREVVLKKITWGSGHALEASTEAAPEAALFTDPVSVPLRLDDGGVGGAAGPGYAIIANRLTPLKYPATLTQIVFVISSNGDDHVPRDVEIDIALDPSGGDLGPKGPSTQVVLEAVVQLPDVTYLNSFLTFTLPPELQTTIYCGDLYLILRDPSSEGTPYFLDTTLPQGRSWASADDGHSFAKLPSVSFPDNGSWLLRGDVDVEREPCDLAKLAGSWVVNTYKGCPAAKFSLDGAGHVGACCGLANATFYGYPCGANVSCSPSRTQQAVNLTVNPTTCSFSISTPFVYPTCARHTWDIVFLDSNTAIQKYTAESRMPASNTCPTPNTCTYEHPISGHEGYPSGHPALEPVRGVTIGPSKADVSWTTGPADVTSYRVMRGDLSCVKTPTVPSDPVVCLTPAGVASPPVSDAAPLPAAGACSAGIRGYYYLVQPVTSRQRGSLNACSAFQTMPRNENPLGNCP